MEDPHIYFRPESEGPLQNKSVAFARCVCRVCHSLTASEWIDKSAIQQKFLAGTSVFAESRKDFIHKLKIAEKELAEFYLWNGLLQINPMAMSESDANILLALAADTRRLLRSVILTSRGKAASITNVTP